MKKIGKTEQTNAITALLPTVLEEIAPLANGENLPPTRYLLLVNGRVPRGEPLRSSERACRLALRRRLHRALRHQMPHPKVTERLTWWRYTVQILDQIITQLERNGVVEYRAITFNQSIKSLVS